jgi:hypothetical protein
VSTKAQQTTNVLHWQRRVFIRTMRVTIANIIRAVDSLHHLGRQVSMREMSDHCERHTYGGDGIRID